MFKFKIPNNCFAAVLMYHRIGDPLSGKEPISDGLKVSEEVFEKTINYFLQNGYEFISLDTLYEMMQGRIIPKHNKNLCLTFDDGYKDNLQALLPLAEKYQLPFAVYVAAYAPEGHLFTWWNTLEELLFKYDELSLSDGSHYEWRNMEERFEVFWKLRAKVIAMAKGRELEKTFKELFAGYDFDLYHYAKEQYLNWDEVRELDSSPLCTIAAHTCTHMAMDVADADEMRREMDESLGLLQKNLGYKITHFAYPFGAHSEVSDKVIAEYADKIKTFTTTENGFVSLGTSRFLIPRIHEIEKFLFERRLFDWKNYSGKHWCKGLVRIAFKSSRLSIELLKAMNWQPVDYEAKLGCLKIKFSIGNKI